MFGFFGAVPGIVSSYSSTVVVYCVLGSGTVSVGFLGTGVYSSLALACLQKNAIGAVTFKPFFVVIGWWQFMFSCPPVGFEISVFSPFVVNLTFNLPSLLNPKSLNVNSNGKLILAPNVWVFLTPSGVIHFLSTTLLLSDAIKRLRKCFKILWPLLIPK